MLSLGKSAHDNLVMLSCGGQGSDHITNENRMF